MRTPLKIWEPFVSLYEYVIGIDVSYGIGWDFTVMQVLRVPREPQELIEQVAVWRSNKIPPAEAAVEAYKLGIYYGSALIGVELQGPGQSMIDTLASGHTQHPQTSGGYPSLYSHTPKGRRIVEVTRRLGWSTGSKDQKAIMLGGLQDIINNESILIRCRTTLKELAGYSRVMVQSKIGKPPKEEYAATFKDPETERAHDDSLMSLAIAHQMVKHVLDPTNSLFPARKRK